MIPQHKEAGLKAGDLVSEVQDISLKDKSINDAVKLMRGEPGTKVKVKILREKEGGATRFRTSEDRS